MNLRNGQNQHSTSCFHKDHTMELYCLTSIQRIGNYESRHNNKETACTILLTDQTRLLKKFNSYFQKDRARHEIELLNK